MNVELNKIFIITKGNRSARWKIVEHPYFDSYAIVCDHLYLKNGKCSKEDEHHIGFGGFTIDKAYKSAYDHT